MIEDYQRGWRDAFDVISDYIEVEVCPVTGQMIRRMKDEGWRYPVVSGNVEQAEGEHGEEIASKKGKKDGFFHWAS